ncbi:MAG: hypothetical protein H6843_07920 [Rhodospirillaceae bacterium]|nr:hypothetical protein [Rhodospirillaceae bacterium]
MTAIAVIDIGKTNQKVLAFDAAGRCLDIERALNAPLAGPPYPHMDVDGVWTFICAALARLARRHTIAAVVTTGYGSTAALVDETGLVLPIADYEHEPPADLVADYAALAPPFAEAFAPTNPGGLTLGRQLHWLKRAYPDCVAAARHLLLHPQYWAWRLSGVAAAEVTSLGAQTHLWNPRAGIPTGFAQRQGWADLLPPLRRAWEVLGPVTPAVAAATGLAADTPVLCGIHDSNANYLRYLAGMDAFGTLMSTGTWLIAFSRTCPPDDLAPERDTNTNTDAFGRPVACARFMLGREFALAGGGHRPLTAADLQGVIDAGTRVLPSFTDSGGPVPDSGLRGRVVGHVSDDPIARSAAAMLYAALTSVESLRAVKAKGPIVIDGGFAEAPMYAELIAALCPGDEVLVSTHPEGTAAGAALLWRWGERPAPVPAVRRVTAAQIQGLDAYADTWRVLAKTP